jgi:hypothetical protein
MARDDLAPLALITRTIKSLACPARRSGSFPTAPSFVEEHTKHHDRSRIPRARRARI